MALCYIATLSCELLTFATRSAQQYAGWIAACTLGRGCKEAMVMTLVAVLLYIADLAAGSLQRAIVLRRGLIAGFSACWAI